MRRIVLALALGVVDAIPLALAPIRRELLRALRQRTGTQRFAETVVRDIERL